MISGATAIFSLIFTTGFIQQFTPTTIRNYTGGFIVGASGITATLLLGALITGTTTGWVTVTGVDKTPAALIAVGLVITPVTGMFMKLAQLGTTTTTQANATRTDSTLVDDIGGPVPAGDRVYEQMLEDDPTATTTNTSSVTGKEKRASTSSSTQPQSTEQDDEPALDTTQFEFDWQTETNVSFDDVGGMQDLKRTLRKEVIIPLVERREEAEALGVGASNIIFHGPPGTGKTYMANALATELGLPVTNLSGADIKSKWINESGARVNTLFNEAAQVADEAGGAVIFFDELDSVLLDRTGGGRHEEDIEVVNEFLSHLDETGEHNIVFIGATNRNDALDEAGTRSGRIDKEIEIAEPDTEARKDIFRAQLQDRPTELSEDDLVKLAESTEGLVAADIEAIVEKAAKEVLVSGGDTITCEVVSEEVKNHLE